MPRKNTNNSSTKDSTANLGFEAKLWLAADTATRASANRNGAATWRDLRRWQVHRSNNMDAAEYSRAERDRLLKAARRVRATVRINHVVLGLIFLKYISDTFEEHRAKLLAGEGDYAGSNPEDPDTAMRASARRSFRRSRIPQDFCGAKDQYKAENVFWVPADARWSQLQVNANFAWVQHFIHHLALDENLNGRQTLN